MRIMHRWWRLGVILGIVVLGALGVPGVIEARAVTSYVDDDRRFTFDVPDGWIVDTSLATGAFVSYTSMQPLGEFDLNILDADGESSLDLLVKATERQLSESFDNYTLTGTTPTKLGDETAQQIAYTATVSDTLLSFSQILCVHNGSVYALTISALPEDIDNLTLQETALLQSWTFI